MTTTWNTVEPLAERRARRQATIATAPAPDPTEEYERFRARLGIRCYLCEGTDHDTDDCTNVPEDEY